MVSVLNASSTSSRSSLLVALVILVDYSVHTHTCDRLICISRRRADTNHTYTITITLENYAARAAHFAASGQSTVCVCACVCYACV